MPLLATPGSVVRRLAALGLWWIVCGSAVGQGYSGIGAAFTDVGIGARTAGMGYAGTARTEGVEALLWNVAGIGRVQRAEIVFSYVDQFELITFEHAAIAVPFGGRRFGIAASATSTGDDALREYTASLGFAWRYRWIRIGAGARYRRATFGRNTLSDSEYIVFDPDEIAEGIQRQVFGTADGFGIDAGLLLKPLDDFVMGLSLRNIAAPMRWNSTSTARSGKYSYVEHIPMEMTIGMAYMRDRGSIAMDWSPGLTRDVSDRIALGVEFKPIDLFALRAGRHMIGDGARNESVTLGFGVDLPEWLGVDLSADYAYITSDLALTQQVTLRLTL